MRFVLIIFFNWQLFAFGQAYVPKIYVPNINSSTPEININQRQEVNVNAKVNLQIEDKADMERLQMEQNAAIRESAIQSTIRFHKIKLEDYILIYQTNPAIEYAFKIAYSSKILFGYGVVKDRFGPISNEHKLQVVKFNGRYKKYKKETQKG